MNWVETARAIVGSVTASGILAGAANIGHRRRRHIRENVKLLKELDEVEALERGWAMELLKDKIALDIVRLSGAKLGARKKPIGWRSAVFCALIAGGFSYWTYALNTDHNKFHFNGYSLITGSIAFIMAFSTMGHFVNRELPPEGESRQPRQRKSKTTATNEEQPAAAITDPALQQLADNLGVGISTKPKS